MSHEELRKRIRNMKHMGILRMSPSNFALLTDNFCEELVRYILVNGETNERQRELINVIKDKYGEYRKEIGDVTWGGPFTGKKYPEYMNKLDFEIDCGDIIKDDSQMIGSWDTEDITNLILTHDVIEEKLIQNEDQMTQDIYNQLDSRIAELEAENASLKQQLEECQIQPQVIVQQQAGTDEWVEELFAHLCYGDEQVARDILSEIRGKEDTAIADIIFERKHQNKISLKTQNRELWKILHAAKLYRSTEGNFNTALRRRQKR